MNLLYQSAFARALGWSLIDSMWQMGAIWIIYIIITRNGSRFSAEKRHSLALFGTVTGTLIFFISLTGNYYNVIYNNSLFSLALFVGKEARNIAGGYAYAQQFIPFLTLLYVPAVFFSTIRLVYQLSINKHIYRNNLMAPTSSVTELVRNMSERFRIVKKAGLWIAEKAESPLTIGYWKPLIILPVAVFSHLTCRQVEAVIAHELFHIKRNDYLINIYLTFTEVVFFFNPFARLMAGIIKKERENSCDDMVIAAGFDTWEYSQALYILGRHRYNRHDLAIAATGIGKEFLLHRIRRIMKRSNPSPAVVKPFIAFFLCLSAAGFAVRQKQVPESADASMHQIKTIIYYSEEKEITNTRTRESKTAPRKEKAIKNLKRALSPEATLQEVAIMPGETEDEKSGQLQSTYIASPQVPVFTYIDPSEPETPHVICEMPQPFIPKSSFYYTEIDTVAGRKIVDL